MSQAWRGLTYCWVAGVWFAVVGQARSGMSQCWVLCSNWSGLERIVTLLVVVVVSSGSDQEWRGALLGCLMYGMQVLGKPGGD